tara:strand:- start:3711 stop:3944 length:234 start_codon:yes stop_codon:yes gene_type:complete
MDTKYVHIFTGSMIEVNRLVSDLSEEDIKSIVEDEGKSAVLAGFALPNLSLTHRLLVKKKDVKKAETIINNYLSNDS